MTDTSEAAISSDPDTTLVVAIPTFRRPALLTALLDSLAPQVVERKALVLIGDNDCDPAVRTLIESYGRGVRVRYRPVAERGVAAVRNALVAEATKIAPSWRWLMMLDDDGAATAGWLDAIVACAERFDADLVGGPVEGVIPAGSGSLARNSIFARRRRWPTGPVVMLNTTQNLAIARRLVADGAAPLFDPRYGASGGEDYDLFRRVLRDGGRLVWCDEAVVIEPAPPERLTTTALLDRYYTTGIYIGVIDRDYDGRRPVLAGGFRGLFRGAYDAVAGTLRGDRDRGAAGTLMTIYHVGYLLSLFGARTSRYVQPEATR